MSRPPADQTFDALANPARRELLHLLLDHGEQPVNQLAAHFAMRRPSVSEHLKVLRDAGLVSERKRGRQRYYGIRPQPLVELRDWLAPFESFWQRKMGNLRDLLDEENP